MGYSLVRTESPLLLFQAPQDPQILIHELKWYHNISQYVIEFFLLTAAQDIETVSSNFSSAYTQEQFQEFE